MADIHLLYVWSCWDTAVNQSRAELQHKLATHRLGYRTVVETFIRVLKRCQGGIDFHRRTRSDPTPRDSFVASGRAV